MNRIIIFLLFPIGLFFTFYRFWAWGTEGTDEIMYQKIALEWLNGNLTLNYPDNNIHFFRPVLYLVQAISFYVFGTNIWAIKLMNLLMIIAVLILTILTSQRLKLRSYFIYLPSLMILFHPHVMVNSRMELAHLTSLLFVSLALYFFVRAMEEKRTAFFCLFSFSLHLSVLTHPDLVLLLPGFLSIILIEFVGKEKSKNLIAVKYLAIALISFLIPSLICCFIWSPTEIFSSLEHNRTYKVLVNNDYPLMMFSQFLSYGMVCMIGYPFTILFYLSVLFRAFFNHVQDSNLRYLRFVLFPVLSYFILFPLLITRNNFDRIIRLLIPLIPFLVLYINIEVQKLYQIKPKLTLSLSFLFLALTPLTMSYQKPLYQKNIFEFYKPSSDFSVFNFKTSNQKFFESVGGLINDSHRLLVAPSFVNLHRSTWALSLPFYFGENAISLNTCASNKENLDQFIQNNKIDHVLIYKTADYYGAFKIQKDKMKDSNTHPCLFEQSEYLPSNLNDESKKLRQYLNSLGAIKVATELGELYKLPIRP